MAMTNEELQTKIAVHDEKFDAFLREMQDFKNELRDRDNRRAAENEEIRNSIKEIYKATDEKIANIENKISSMTSHIQMLSITAMGGIIAAGVGIAAMVWSVLNR